MWFFFSLAVPPQSGLKLPSEPCISFEMTISVLANIDKWLNAGISVRSEPLENQWDHYLFPWVVLVVWVVHVCVHINVGERVRRLCTFVCSLQNKAVNQQLWEEEDCCFCLSPRVLLHFMNQYWPSDKTMKDKLGVLWTAHTWACLNKQQSLLWLLNKNVECPTYRLKTWS